MSMGDSAEGTVLFAQVNNFSFTNDALTEALKPHIGKLRIETFRVYPKIVGNKFLLLICIVAVLYYYGLRDGLNRKLVQERLIKTPVFFRLASYLIRRRAAKIPDLKAVLQTQGLFDAKCGALPLIIYTDNTILNSINRAEAAPIAHNPITELEKELYKTASVIAVSAGHVATSLVTDYGIASAVPSVVYIGANAPTPPPSPDDRYRSQRILFVGIDWERKGGPDLVAAFRGLSERFPDATLTIVGARPDLADANITVLGKIPPLEVSRLMSISAVYCMPSYVEPSSVAVIEAARSGLPVVATASGGFLDSVDQGKTGLLVPVGDAKALEHALGELLSDPARIERMGAAGQDFMKRFSWDSVGEKVAALIVSSASAGSATKATSVN